MVLYFSVLVIMLLIKKVCEHFNYKTGKIYGLILMGIYGLISAVRVSYVGNDTRNYLSIFNEVNSGVDTSGWYNRFEAGFVLLNKVCAFFFDNSQCILIIAAIIIYMGFSLLVVKYSKDYWLSAFLFITLGYFGSTMNAIRLCMAYSIIIIAYDRLVNNNIKAFILLILMAMLFHKTAIVFLICAIVPYLKKLRFSFKIWLILTILAYVLTPLIVKLMIKIFPIYEYYVDNYMTNGVSLGILLYIFVWTMILCIGLYIQKKCGKEIDKNIKYLNYLMMLTISILVLSMHFTLLDRVAQYFGLFSIIYVPNCINIVENRKMQYMLKCVVVVCFLVYFVGIQLLRPEWNRIATYGVFWM